MQFVPTGTKAKYAGMAELADAYDSGSYERKFLRVQVPFPAPIMKESLVWLFYYFMRKFIGLEPALGEAEHNREFARHLRMMGRAHQVLSPAPKNRNPICSGFCFLYIAKQFPKKILSLDSCIAKGEYLFE